MATVQDKRDVVLQIANLLASTRPKQTFRVGEVVSRAKELGISRPTVYGALNWGEFFGEMKAVGRGRWKVNRIREGRLGGLSSSVYDVHVANVFGIYPSRSTDIADPYTFDSKSTVDVQGGACIVPPNSLAIGRSLEYFRIPKGVVGFCSTKPAYVRLGVNVNITPLDSGWEGIPAIELSNTGPRPVRIHSGTSIAKVTFLGKNIQHPICKKATDASVPGPRQRG